MTEQATVPKSCGLATASLVCGILSLVSPDGYIKKMPVCQAGGTYTLNGSNEPPTCSVGGKHTLRSSAPPPAEQ